MNIEIILGESNHSFETGGEYAIAKLDVYIDKTLPFRIQRGLIIHAIVENYLRSIPHSRVDELTEYLQDGLEQLPQPLNPRP